MSNNHININSEFDIALRVGTLNKKKKQDKQKLLDEKLIKLNEKYFDLKNPRSVNGSIIKRAKSGYNIKFYTFDAWDFTSWGYLIKKSNDKSSILVNTLKYFLDQSNGNYLPSKVNYEIWNTKSLVVKFYW